MACKRACEVVKRTCSKEMSRFIAAVDSTTSSKQGTAPPASEELPPCGTTASRRALQCCSTCKCVCTAAWHTQPQLANLLQIDVLCHGHLGLSVQQGFQVGETLMPREAEQAGLHL
jgi:hypothetical protein